MYKFTEEEKQKIEKAMNIILDDIRELWKASQTDQIDIKINMDGSNSLWNQKWKLTISDKIICLHNNDSGKDYILEKINHFGVVRRPIDYDIDFRFIDEYPTTRDIIENKIAIELDRKNHTFGVLDEINKKYNVEASVTIELPETTNRYEIEITREDGRSIGTLNIGEHIIRIATDSNIIIHDKKKSKQPQEKTLHHSKDKH